jgi:hypothetical protein
LILAPHPDREVILKTTLTAAFVAMVALLAAVLLRTVLAGEPEGTVADSAAADSSTTATAAVDPATADYERLGREYEKLLAAEEEVFPYPRDTNQPADTTLSDEHWLQQRLAKQASAPDPDTLLPQFVTFRRKPFNVSAGVRCHLLCRWSLSVPRISR